MRLIITVLRGINPGIREVYTHHGIPQGVPGMVGVLQYRAW